MVDRDMDEYRRQEAAQAKREAKPKYWTGTVDETDDFGHPIDGEFIDGRTMIGPWASMSPRSWARHGVGKLGTGNGQRYRKQADGKWLKVEG